MASGLADAIRGLVHEKGISEDLVRKTIEDFLYAAYKRKFGTVENAVVRFNDDYSEVSIFARKSIVEEITDPVFEIELKDALELNDECEIGDELLIEINPKDFDRGAVQSAKQKARQTLREIHKDTLYSEFKDKEGEMIIGYHQRERNGNIFVDLGKIEGILPKRYQSPRESYHPNDRIKALIYEVSKSPSGLQIILSRTHTDFVKRIFELEVPEIYDKTVEIFKIVREPGYRTKISVFSNREDVDPVGACVGIKGVRIQAIVRELEGEKIDILKYVTDQREFIKNALSPAEVENVIILDESKRQALAIVNESQLSLAIGKKGLNVRLANRLVDWNIDVKTVEQFEEMDISIDSKRELNALFNDIEEEITSISELPGISEHLVELLTSNKVELIETLVSMDRNDLENLEGITEEDIKNIETIISENVDIVEEEELEEEEFFEEPEEKKDEEESPVEEETYECPECGAPITIDMTSCPACGIGLRFEEEEPDNQDGEELKEEE
ncbi:MAG: transcription termination/antitermination protein NusA [Spirochaetes bacterium]|nr:MAG: transcription termination/antitermination protein NusA [Spirochaetota bacterium]